MKRYIEQKNMLGRRVGKLVKRVATSFVGMTMCIGRAIPKCSLREIPELDNFSKQLCRRWIGHSEQSSGSAIDIRGGECVVLLNSFSLVEVGI